MWCILFQYLAWTDETKVIQDIYGGKLKILLKALKNTKLNGEIHHAHLLGSLIAQKHQFSAGCRISIQFFPVATGDFPSWLSNICKDRLTSRRPEAMLDNLYQKCLFINR